MSSILGESFGRYNGKIPESAPEPVTAEVVTDPPKRKRGRPRKEEQQQSTSIVEVGQNKNSMTPSLPICQTNEPYQNTYDETNNMLRFSVMQLDTLAVDVKGEIDAIKNSKTLKGKYKYMSDLCATASSIIGSKISAIKEMNSVTTKCHELEMRRIKEIKSVQAQQDDDKYIADLYNAYINTPIGGMQHPAMQYTSSNVAGNMGALMSGIDAVPNNEEQGFANYMQNLTPEQNRMINGDNPNIETVVVYNPNTGDKDFDVIDTSTGMPVPNYPRPNRGLLDDVTIDFSTGIASNSNIGQHWKVFTTTGDDIINHF
jgi:hypothetical protein